jgi:hypothetical protein
MWQRHEASAKLTHQLFRADRVARQTRRGLRGPLAVKLAADDPPMLILQHHRFLPDLSLSRHAHGTPPSGDETCLIKSARLACSSLH